MFENLEKKEKLENLEPAEEAVLESSTEALTEDEVKILNETDSDPAEAKKTLEAVRSDDENDLADIEDKAEATETNNGPEEIVTVDAQGTSCGSGHGCSGSHYCGYGY